MATGEDQVIKCVDCGEDFLFTAGEQSFFREKGLTHPPTRCKRCREPKQSQPGIGSLIHFPSPSARSIMVTWLIYRSD